MRGAYPRIVRRATALAGGLVLAFGAPFARSAPPILPSGASVAAGQASVAAQGGTSLLVTQSSQKALINWQSFSIGAGADITFQQPNSAAITLNRVVGVDASVISGNLFANGQVWLINGNGILFSQGSRIDVGGLIATTSDMRDADFLAGKYDFGIASGNPNAAVVNQGSIKAAAGGSAVLSGARVANDGVIEANLGKVVLAGANAFSVDFNGDNLIRFAITAPVAQTPRDANSEPAHELVSNSGTIAAQGGKILLTARAARSVVHNVINTTGIIEATSASMQNGEIVLDAGQGGTASVSGRLDATGKNAGETGGAITLLGDIVTVASGANLNASGDAGGGTVLIGGNLHGNGPEPNALKVNVGAATIAADASGNGNGGMVAIYSVGPTNVAASISAKGGGKGGDGGMVETAGHDVQIAEDTHVDTSAPAGATGSWLVDSLNINVVGGFPGGIEALINNPAGTNFVSPITIMAALDKTNVKLEASNDINVVDAVNYNSANSLTFLAKRNVTLNSSLQNGGTGDIIAVAGWNGAIGPAGIPGALGPGGDLTLAGGALISTNGSGDALVLTAGGNFINLAGGAALNVSGGGRWLIFLADPTNNTAGGLSASPFFNRVFDFLTDRYAAIAAKGNRFVYALAPKLNVTLDNKTRTYGSANPAFTATITGLAGGDTISGTPSFSTTATASSAVGDYPIIGSLGTLVSDFNYGFQFANATLHIDPATLTYVANAASRTYGSSNPLFSGTLTGFVNGETQATATGGTLAFTSAATAAGHVGSYAINGSGLTANNGNYNFVQAAGNTTALTIDPATLTASLTGSVAKIYDGTDLATLTPGNYTLDGVVSGDSVVLNDPANGLYDDKEVGNGKQVTVSGLALSGADVANYVLASTQASGAVGVIATPPVDNGILANLTGRPLASTPLASATAAAPTIMSAADSGGQNVSDATSSTTSAIGEESAPSNAVANTVGQSLSGVPGSVPSWTNVLIQGLLRQFDPPPGASRPRAVPSVDQIYSSWGNEAFWQ